MTTRILTAEQKAKIAADMGWTMRTVQKPRNVPVPWWTEEETAAGKRGIEAHTITLRTPLVAYTHYTMVEDHFPRVLAWVKENTESFIGVQCRESLASPEHLERAVRTGRSPDFFAIADFTFADIEDAVLFRLRWV